MKKRPLSCRLFLPQPKVHVNEQAQQDTSHDGVTPFLLKGMATAPASSFVRCASVGTGGT